MAKVDQRYQASLTLHPEAGKGGDLVRSIQRTICKWVTNSEKRLYNDQGCHLTSKFFEESNVRSLKPRASSVITDVHYSTDGAAWCMCYRHSDSEVRGVDWITDVGLRLNGDGNVIMSVVLTTSTTGEVLLRKDDGMEWRSTIPMFVRLVLSSKMIKQISVSGLVLPMSMELARVVRGTRFKNINVNWVRTEVEAKDVLKIINSPRRRFAVLLVMGEGPNAKREALNLGFGLCGKSYVCIVKYDYAVFKHFKEFEIPFDHVKVLLPFHKHDNNDRHPIYRIGGADEQKMDRERVVESQLGYVTSFEEGAVHCLEDIASLNRQDYFRRKNSEFKLVLAKKKVSDQDAADMLAYAESIQKDYENEKNRAEALQKRCDDYTIEIEGLKDEAQQKLLSLEQKYNGQLRRRKESAQIPRAFPNKIKDLKEWSKLLCNLRIDEHAWQGMEGRDNAESIGEAWTMLWHLNFTMCKIRFEESGHDDIRTVFKDRSGYTYTADENVDVKKKWVEGHKAIVDGQEFMCWRHIKRGNDNVKLMRIYFEFDLDRHYIVISWIGSHLKTNLTKCQ